MSNDTNHFSSQAAGEQSPPSSSSSLWYWLVLVVVAGAALIFLLKVGPSQKDFSEQALGKPLPALQLTPLTASGDPLTLEDVRGNVTLINYWGTWCPPCRIEFPHLTALAQELQGHDDFLFASVSCEAGRGVTLDQLKTQTQAFLDEHAAALPTYCDPSGESRHALMEVLELEGFAYPTTVLLDRSGVIQRVWRGYEQGMELEMRQAVSQLLGNT